MIGSTTSLSPDSRTAEPIRRDSNTSAWVVTGYEAARQILASPYWSSDPTVGVSSGELNSIAPLGRSMLLLDPPDHTRVRDSVRDVFTPHYIEQLTTGIESIAGDVVGSVLTGVTIDLMTEVAQPFPLAVISAWMDLGKELTHTIAREAAPLVRGLDGILISDLDLAEAAGSFTAVVKEVLPLADRRRDDPGDDLLSLLASDPRLDLEEVLVNAILLTIAGHETTAGFLGNATSRLLDGTSTERLIDRVDVRDPQVIDELLRLDGPVQLIGRSCSETHDVMGHRFERGEQLIVHLGAAQRDPSVFEDPDEFRLDRNHINPPLAFGHGRHRCLGAALSRKEIAIGLQRIVERGPILAGPVTWRDNLVLRAPESVPITFLRGVQP